MFCHTIQLSVSYRYKDLEQGYVVVLSQIRLFVTLWTVAHQAPLSMGFSRQEYWSGLPFPSLGDLPNLGIEPVSLEAPALAGGFFTNSSNCEAILQVCHCRGFQIFYSSLPLLHLSVIEACYSYSKMFAISFIPLYLLSLPVWENW